MQASERTDTYKLFAAGFIILSALVSFYVFANHSLLGRVLVLLAATGVAIWIAIKTQLGAETLEFMQGLVLNCARWSGLHVLKRLRPR